MDCSMPGFCVHHQLPELTQTHVHWVSEAIQPSHPLSSPFPPAFNLSQHQGLFQWVSSSHQVAKVLEFQLQHQSFQWIFMTYLLWDGLVGSPCSPRDSQESSPTPQFKSIDFLANLIRQSQKDKHISTHILYLEQLNSWQKVEWVVQGLWRERKEELLFKRYRVVSLR